MSDPRECPTCGGRGRVSSSTNGTGYRRRRWCKNCDRRWTTVEVLEDEARPARELESRLRSVQHQRQNELLAAIRSLQDYAVDGNSEHLAVEFLRVRLEEIAREQRRSPR